MKYLNMEFKEKQKGRNHDLSVMEYKVKQELYTVKEVNKDLKWECKKLKEKQRYQKEQYEELDWENNALSEDSRVLEYFKEYLPREMYEEIVDIAERQHERQKNREKFY